jgi:hypothetical protein
VAKVFKKLIMPIPDYSVHTYKKKMNIIKILTIIIKKDKLSIIMAILKNMQLADICY